MPTYSNDNVSSISTSTHQPAVKGEGVDHVGPQGVSHNTHPAVQGINDFAPSKPGAGGNGAWFESSDGEGVRGLAKTPHHGGVVGVNTAGGYAVYGLSNDGIAVAGESTTNEGMRGVSHGKRSAVTGLNDSPASGGPGGWFESATGEGVRGTSRNAAHGAVVGVNTGGGDAGYFAGNVHVTGLLEADHLKIRNADFAEEFAVVAGATAEAGMVMVLEQGLELEPCTRAYDRRVAGVISGAGSYKPGILLDRQGGAGRQPIALLGKVYCQVDADLAPIEMGDLLTTSPTLGHAMKAADAGRSFGAVIGKALESLPSGRGLIPVLITLL